MQPPRIEPPSRDWKRLFVIALLAFSAFAVYRIFAVYTVRTGDCLYLDDRPAEVVTPRVPPAAALSAPVRVMSYNIEGHANLLDGEHLEEIAAVIARHRPDIVGLQEIHRGTWQARFGDQARELARLTGMNVWFGPSFEAVRGEYGNAIMTHGRIETAIVHELPSRGEPRSLLEATIALPAGRMKLFTTHLAAWGPLNRRIRKEQLHCIAAHLRRTTLPWVVLGDLNATPRSEEIEELATRIRYELAGDPDLVTHPFTNSRLDYILAGRGWRIREAAVLEEDVSDHRPVVAIVEWAGAAEERE